MVEYYENTVLDEHMPLIRPCLFCSQMQSAISEVVVVLKTNSRVVGGVIVSIVVWYRIPACSSRIVESKGR